MSVGQSILDVYGGPLDGAEVPFSKVVGGTFVCWVGPVIQTLEAVLSNSVAQFKAEWFAWSSRDRGRFRVQYRLRYDGSGIGRLVYDGRIAS